MFRQVFHSFAHTYFPLLRLGLGHGVDTRLQQVMKRSKNTQLYVKKKLGLFTSQLGWAGELYLALKPSKNLYSYPFEQMYLCIRSFQLCQTLRNT